jgi:hypothetical protein
MCTTSLSGPVNATMYCCVALHCCRAMLHVFALTHRSVTHPILWPPGSYSGTMFSSPFRSPELDPPIVSISRIVTFPRPCNPFDPLTNSTFSSRTFPIHDLDIFDSIDELDTFVILAVCTRVCSCVHVCACVWLCVCVRACVCVSLPAGMCIMCSPCACKCLCGWIGWPMFRRAHPLLLAPRHLQPQLLRYTTTDYLSAACIFPFTRHLS